MNVQEAIAEAKRVARAHCPRCGDGPIPVMAARAGTPHTCEQDLAAVREVMLAAHDDACALCHYNQGACQKRARIQVLAQTSAGDAAAPAEGVEQVIREMRRLVRLNPYAVPMKDLRSLLRRAAAACDGK